MLGFLLFASLLSVSPAAASPLEAPKAEARWRLAALPIANYNSDFGLGGGLRGAAYLGVPEAKLYRLAVDAQIFAATRGTRSFFAGVDAPDLLGTRLRLIARAGYSRNLAAYWFGPDVDGTPRTESPRFLHDERSFWTQLGARAPLTAHLSAFAVHRLQDTGIHAAADTHLREQAPEGFEGNRFSELVAGVLFDSRDHEAQPTRGSFAELSVRGAHALLGSESDTFSAFASWAGFFPLHPRLVLATRLSADRQWGRVAIQRQRDFGGYAMVGGLGGAGTLRGLLQEESIGPLKLLTNTEARVRLLEAKPFGVDTAVGAVLFADVGRSWTGFDAFLATPLALRYGVGAGLRLILQQFFVVRLDVARAESGVRLYLQVGEVF